MSDAPSSLVDDVRRRLIEISERIRAAGGSDITIVGVTKTFGPEVVAAGLAAGLVDLGENYSQDLVAKAEGFEARFEADQSAGSRPRWHFIGGLQRNKVKRLADHVWLWQTIDRDVLVDEVAKRQPGGRILIQVNTTGEIQKSGCDPNEAPSLVERGRRLGLAVEGLMTIGPTSADGGAGDPRPAFDQLRRLADRCEVSQLSMGMSADYELAVAAGATMVRIGSALFGPRG